MAFKYPEVSLSGPREGKGTHEDTAFVTKKVLNLQVGHAWP
jgi:hypothetical protein